MEHLTFVGGADEQWKVNGALDFVKAKATASNSGVPVKETFLSDFKRAYQNMTALEQMITSGEHQKEEGAEPKARPVSFLPRKKDIRDSYHA